jgi:hypothetical protein
MISFDINILVSATASVPDAGRVISLSPASGMDHFIVSGGVRQCNNPQSRNTNRGHPPKAIDAWGGALPIQAGYPDDLAAALEAVRGHWLPFWGAMLWFRRNVPAYGACSPKICKMPSS